MKKIFLPLFSLLLLVTSCSNPNKVFIEKIKSKINNNALGVNLNFKNIDFKLTDTVFVKDSLKVLKKQFDDNLKLILNIKSYIKDDFKEGNIYSLNYITKERLEEL